MTRALDLAQAALAAADGEQAEAVVQSEVSGFARFAASEVHQPTLIENDMVELRVVRDGRVAGAVTNRTSAEALAELARRAREAAERAPRDPSFPGLAPPSEPPAVEGYDERTASLAPEEQAQLAREAIDAARPFGLFGYVTSGVTEIAVASSTGIAVSQRLTDASVLALAADDTASGYAEQASARVADVNPAGAAREAAEKAAQTRGGQEIELGRYRAVLEPYAIAELLEYFALHSFSGLRVLEEASYFAGRIGERAFDSKVSLADDALDPVGLPKAFDFEGVPKHRVELVTEGVLRGVVWDRATAARAGDGTQSTGHAVRAEDRSWGPQALAVSMAAGDAKSLEELAERVGDGIHVTRLHYLSVVSPREGIVTGMTRDGTFRIRDGRRAEPLVNLRFTVSVPELLAEVPGLTRERKLVNRAQWYGDRYPYGYVVPGLATACFTVTGNGSAPGL
ncbi:MAG: TldD/PmbA family protein [Gaiellaceae bacterium]